MLVDFYLLSATPLERTLPAICEKVLGAGERLLVVADAAALQRLDVQLWSCARDSFLPHGLGSAPSAELQPVLLSEEVEAVNGATNVALADGVWREEALRFERVFYFFDTGTADCARAAWTALKGREGVERRYWKQDERGKWVQGP